METNKDILQSHNMIITDNENIIDEILELVNEIPEAVDPVLQEKTVSPSTSSQTVKPDSGYDGLSQVTVNAMTTATQATPSITVSSSGLITASATQTAGYVSAGTKSTTQQLTTKGDTTYIPTTSDQTIASGTYLTGTQTIKGDSNLVASNIKSGVSIFGVTGTMSGSEDLSSELNTQNSLITTQETTIDNIISALQGKAGGGSGGGISSESVNLDLTIISESAGHRPIIYYTTSEQGFNEAWYVEVTSNSFSTTLNVIKHSYIFIVPPNLFAYEVTSDGASSGIEVISSGILAAQVNGSGTLSVSCQGQ